MNNNDIVIEHATESSIFLRDAIENLAKQEGENYCILSMQDLQDMLQSTQSFLFIAKHKPSGNIVGMAMVMIYRIPYTKKAYIDDVVVDKSYRNLGIATLLMEHAISVSKQHDVSYIMLTAHIERAAGNRLYQKFGFQQRNSNVYRLELTHEKD